MSIAVAAHHGERHRRSGVAYRCAGEDTRQTVEAFPAYAAVAFAGLGDLPETLASRSVLIHMRRHAPGEHVEPFRARLAEPEGHQLCDRLAQWAAGAKATPDTPRAGADGVLAALHARRAAGTDPLGSGYLTGV